MSALTHRSPPASVTASGDRSSGAIDVPCAGARSTCLGRPVGIGLTGEIVAPLVKSPPPSSPRAQMATPFSRSSRGSGARRVWLAGSGRGRDAARRNGLALNVLTVHLLGDHGGGAPVAVFLRLRRRRAYGHKRRGEEAGGEGDSESPQRHESRLSPSASRFNRPNGLSSASSWPMALRRQARELTRRGQAELQYLCPSSLERARLARLESHHPLF